jgi:hypothetical protein
MPGGVNGDHAYYPLGVQAIHARPEEGAIVPSIGPRAPPVLLSVAISVLEGDP